MLPSRTNRRPLQSRKRKSDMTTLKVTKKDHVAGQLVIQDLGVTFSGKSLQIELQDAVVQKSMATGSLRKLLKLGVIAVHISPRTPPVIPGHPPEPYKDTVPGIHSAVSEEPLRVPQREVEGLSGARGFRDPDPKLKSKKEK